MFLTATPENGIVTKLDKIARRHETDLISRIDHLDPLYAGGYAMALLLAPTGTIHTMFGDYDIYARDQNHFCDLSRAIVEGDTSLRKIKETEKAVTWCEDDDPNTTAPQIQLIKNRMGTPTKILSTFDFFNCAIGWQPYTKTFHIAKEGLVAHQQRELCTQQHENLLLAANKDQQHLAVVAAVRIIKYCKRWNYTLGPELTQVLVDLYQAHPYISIPESKLVAAGSGGGHIETKSFRNFWRTMAPVLRASKYWDDSMDIHNRIIKADQPNPDQLFGTIPW